jgi:hypothetical protein
MLVFATCIILKKQVGVSVAFLSACIISQAVAYGLIFNIVSKRKEAKKKKKKEK